MSMLDNVKIWLLHSPFENVEILGRKSGDYVRREFGAYCAGEINDADECELRDGETGVILSLGAPLVTVEDVENGVECLRRRKLGKLFFGERGSDACAFRRDGKDSGYFFSSSRFCKVDSAKNTSLVYNQMKERIILRHLTAEVDVVDAANTVIDDTVTIFSGAKVMPFCRLTGATVIESGAVVEGSFVRDSVIRRGAQVTMSYLTDTCVGERATVGPFARLRGAEIEADCRIGDFVEIKNSRMGAGAKSAHLAYIGDATVGERTNIGCGTVFCNYDGKNKHRTTVGADCFIGANTNLVAPVEVGDGAFVAAGTTVTENVDVGAFAIGRVRQQNMEKKPTSSRRKKDSGKTDGTDKKD